jgi:hypothetical protein
MAFDSKRAAAIEVGIATLRTLTSKVRLGLAISGALVGGSPRMPAWLETESHRCIH